MTIAIARRVKHVSLALIALSSVTGLQATFAAGTDAGDSIANRATVNYSVGGVAQTAIQSSPTGNTTATGADTTFTVDRRVFFTLTSIAPSATESAATIPGGQDVIRRFTLSNTSNAPLGFRFDNLASTGAFQAANLLVRVDSASQPTSGYTEGTYDSGVDGSTDSVVSLPEDHSITIFVLGDIPASAANGQTSNVDLRAVAIEPPAPNNFGGTAGNDIVATAGANTAGVDTVFGPGLSGGLSATNVYTIASAVLRVTKTVAVISDPINGVSANAKAIPGAVLEYVIEIDNEGDAEAQAVGLTDPIATGIQVDNSGVYSGEDIEIVVNGGTAATCTIEADSDGCALAGNVLTVGGTDRPTIPVNGTATIRFRVTIDL